MKSALRILFVLMLCLPVLASAQNLITNGGFEAGLSGWTVNNAGTGSVIASNSTNVGGLPTVGAASGSFYAVTQQGGPGTHVFSQDFTTTGSVNVSFDMFVNDWDGGPFCGAGLNHTGGAVECGRVDVLTAGSSAFDTGAGVISNLYLGADPVHGTANPYIHYSFDLNLAAGSYTLRFGESDNQSNFAVGVDNVEVVNNTPEPASLALLGSGLLGIGGAVRRKLIAR